MLLDYLGLIYHCSRDRQCLLIPQCNLHVCDPHYKVTVKNENPLLKSDSDILTLIKPTATSKVSSKPKTDYNLDQYHISMCGFTTQ